MTYNTYEYSQRSSAPIELFEFTRGTDAWRYVSGSEESVTYDGNVYTPTLIKRGAIKSTTNTNENVLEITLKIDSPVVTDSIGRFGGDKVLCQVYRIQNENVALLKRIWYGYIVSKQVNDNIAVLRVENILSAFNKRVVKNVASYQCRHELYSSECGLDADLYKTAGTITSITDGTSITAAVFSTGTADRWLSAIIITSSGKKRTIISDPGTGTVVISRPFISVIAGTNFFVYEPCDKSITGLCATALNTANFGGFNFFKNNPYEYIDKEQAIINLNPPEET